ncbi:MAG: HAD family hydrolase [Holdemanella sp.]|nr:HAD family hydrolase [Holdemanella sp.]
MDKKIIFFDIDGTILHGKEISEKVKYTLDTLIKNGHYTFINTGRNEGDAHIKDANLYGRVCSAGAYIEMENKVIFEHDMDYKDVCEILDFFKQHDIGPCVETNEIVYDDERYSRWIYNAYQSEANSEIIRWNDFIENYFKVIPIDLLDETKHIKKVCFITDKKENVDLIVNTFKDRFNVVCFLQYGGYYNGEISDKTYTKGTAVKHVCDLLNMSIEDTIAFGDEMNDVEMLKACHIGICMENGNQGLKDVATCICESVEQDGIYYECKRRGLI